MLEEMFSVSSAVSSWPELWPMVIKTLEMGPLFINYKLFLPPVQKLGHLTGSNLSSPRLLMPDLLAVLTNRFSYLIRITGYHHKYRSGTLKANTVAAFLIRHVRAAPIAAHPPEAKQESTSRLLL